MARIDVLGSGLVYRNDKPHLRSRHAYFPSLAELPGGEVVAGFDVGSAFEAVDVRSYCARSTDGGATWSAPQQIFTPDTSRHAVSTSCRLSMLGEELVGLACLMDRPDPEQGLANPATEGFVDTHFALVRSRDGGRSWGKPAPLALPVDWNHFEVCSPVVATRIGRWLIPTAPWPDWNGNAPLGQKSLVFVSDDKGRTWSKGVDTLNRAKERVAHYEQKVVTLSDGRIMSLCWTIDLKNKQNLPNHYALSTDNADSFSAPPLATPLRGETCTPLALRENHVLCVYRRADKPGLWAHLGRIEESGSAWHGISDAQLWVRGVVNHDTHQESLLEQMSTLRFGCPSVIRLAGGDVLTAFWCVEDGVSNIRWFRLRVEM